MRRVRRLKTGGVVVGRMAKGCRLCILGAKMVLFITGLCDLNCYYCPISYKRRGKDLIYADEVLVEKDEDIIREAKLIRALGTGITGGEPLMVPERVLYYINLLKEVFGKKHHIHLYTYGRNLDESLMGKLAEAGLDEIRFHADIENSTLWERVLIAKGFDWDIGVEIPAIPGKLNQTKKLIDYFHDIIYFHFYCNCIFYGIAMGSSNAIYYRAICWVYFIRVWAYLYNLCIFKIID